MYLQIKETATMSKSSTEYKKVSKPEQREWTAQNLGIKLSQKEQSFTKADFEHDLKKVCSPK